MAAPTLQYLHLIPAIVALTDSSWWWLILGGAVGALTELTVRCGCGGAFGDLLSDVASIVGDIGSSSSGGSSGYSSDSGGSGCGGND